MSLQLYKHLAVKQLKMTKGLNLPAHQQHMKTWKSMYETVMNHHQITIREVANDVVIMIRSFLECFLYIMCGN